MRLKTAPAGILAAALLALAAPAHAGAELVLADGRILSGVSVERKGETFQLTDESGVVAAIPAALVKQMRLTGGDAPPPTGLTFSQPGALAGFEAPPPGRREMLAAFGKPPVIFRPPGRTERWAPQDGFEGKDETQFRPARWAEPVFDFVWRPLSVFTPDNDVTEFRPVRWRPSIVDTTWRPRDGFGPTGWFSPAASSPSGAE